MEEMWFIIPNKKKNKGNPLDLRTFSMFYVYIKTTRTMQTELIQNETVVVTGTLTMKYVMNMDKVNTKQATQSGLEGFEAH